MKRTTILMAAFVCLFSLTDSPAQNTQKNMELLNLTQEWGKTFPKKNHLFNPFDGSYPIIKLLYSNSLKISMMRFLQYMSVPLCVIGNDVSAG